MAEREPSRGDVDQISELRRILASMARKQPPHRQHTCRRAAGRHFVSRRALSNIAFWTGWRAATRGPGAPVATRLMMIPVETGRPPKMDIRWHTVTW